MTTKLIKLYRKNPEMVEALENDGSEAALKAAATFCNDPNVYLDPKSQSLTVELKTGIVEVSKGHFIIREMNNTITVCAPLAFHSYYHEM